VQQSPIWQIGDGRVDWFVLEHGEYLSLSPEDGLLRSRVFPGLALDVEALFDGDLSAVLSRAQETTGTAAHRSVVNWLQARN